MKLLGVMFLVFIVSSGCTTQEQDVPADTAESHRQLAERWGEAVSSQNFEMMSSLMADDYVWHLASGDVAGFDKVKTRFEGLFNGFPDFKLMPIDVVSDGKKVVVRWSVSGTHLGEYLGVEPTGNRVEFFTISIDVVRDGKFAEGWEAVDALGLRTQLGFKLEPPEG
ncbi:MAG: ester cyclase [Candidatus Latescibacterota bacterium]|nr:MAG: ester cyclase [Candidatus Latescibacterota bacterium]